MCYSKTKNHYHLSYQCIFCDGLGDCLGHCPKGAISVEERETEHYDERKVMKNIVKQGKNTIIAYLQHLKDEWK